MHFCFVGKKTKYETYHVHHDGHARRQHDVVVVAAADDVAVAVAAADDVAVVVVGIVVAEAAVDIAAAVAAVVVRVADIVGIAHFAVDIVAVAVHTVDTDRHVAIRNRKLYSTVSNTAIAYGTNILLAYQM